MKLIYSHCVSGDIYACMQCIWILPMSNRWPWFLKKILFKTTRASIMFCREILHLISFGFPWDVIWNRVFLKNYLKIIVSFDKNTIYHFFPYYTWLDEGARSCVCHPGNRIKLIINKITNMKNIVQLIILLVLSN